MYPFSLPSDDSISSAYAVSVCQSVRLSVTIVLFSPSGSHTILVFFTPNHLAIFRRGPYWGVECRRGMKNRDFRPISRFISEMIADKAIMTMERHKNSYAIYRMVPFPMTLIPNSDLKVTPLFDAISETLRARDDIFTTE